MTSIDSIFVFDNNYTDFYVRNSDRIHEIAG